MHFTVNVVELLLLLGTVHPLLVLSPSATLKVKAISNFALNEEDFTYPDCVPEGYGGIIPAMNTL